MMETMETMMETTTGTTETMAAKKRGRANSSYVEGVGMWDDRSAKRWEGAPSTTSSTTTGTRAGFERDGAASYSTTPTTTSFDADVTEVSSPTRRPTSSYRGSLLEETRSRRGGVARALAFDDAARATFPLDPSAMCSM
jgi:hypothetical protein